MVIIIHCCTFREGIIVNRFVFHLSDLAQLCCLAPPLLAKFTLYSLKGSFLLDSERPTIISTLLYSTSPASLQICKEYITRTKQTVCGKEIPTRMLIKLIDRGLKMDLQIKVLIRTFKNWNISLK